LRIRSLYPKAHNEMGLYYMEMGALEDAMRELSIALEGDPNLAAAHNNMGTVYARLGMWDPAIMEFKKALELDPALEAVRENLDKALTAREGRDRGKSR
jgi:Tfp pilus assembly protein PilF